MIASQQLSREEWTTKHPDLPCWDGTFRFRKVDIDMTPLKVKINVDLTPRKIDLRITLRQVGDLK